MLAGAILVLAVATSPPGEGHDHTSHSHTPTPAAACDPSYPAVCIPAPPPVLACSDVARGGFEVVAPDPHGFDEDGDGVGCE